MERALLLLWMSMSGPQRANALGRMVAGTSVAEGDLPNMTAEDLVKEFSGQTWREDHS